VEIGDEVRVSRVGCVIQTSLDRMGEVNAVKVFGFGGTWFNPKDLEVIKKRPPQAGDKYKNRSGTVATIIHLHKDFTVYEWSNDGTGSGVAVSNSVRFNEIYTRVAP
jgi:hypothetical protein